MRAATSKPGWYIRRGLPVPMQVILHRLELVRRREARAEAKAGPINPEYTVLPNGRVVQVPRRVRHG